MRVVAGTAGGRRLVTPPGRDTRPTSDRVREALFNALGSLGAIDGARVLDLFAGSGALGIEALSRGAPHATFVDRDRQALDAVRANLVTAGFADRAAVVPADASAFLATLPPGERFDLALLDPPYAFDGWSDLLAALPTGLAVVESGAEFDPGQGWSVVRQKRYGTTLVTIIRPDNGTTSTGYDPRESHL